MRAVVVTLATCASLYAVTVHAFAGDPAPAAPYALDEVPDAMPFAHPYGAPISLEKAQGYVAAAIAEAKKRGWAMSISVVDSGAAQVAFARMDGANLASTEIAGLKAATAAKFRRSSRVFEDAIQKKGFNYLITLPNVLASRGGIPIIEDGKVVGGIGCSGGTGSQDEVVCAAALGQQEGK
jgi:uncharacterized protein GlcG (DUF336 family)